MIKFLKLCLRQQCNDEPDLFQRVWRFALTGVFVTGLHFFFAIVFVEYFTARPPLANGLAFTFATMASYLINTTWSFSSRLHGKSLFRFTVVATTGVLLTVAISWTVQQLGYGYIIGICAVAVMMPPITFVLHTLWTYR